jgi:ketosteroid isomerase-like protein
MRSAAPAGLIGMSLSSASLLSGASCATRLPAQDLARARAWYADKLGLVPAEEREGGLRYRLAGGDFVLFASSGRPSGTHTQMGFGVDDIERVAAELRGRGVVFEEEGIPGLPMVDGLVSVPGNYPSKGTGERGGWFRDSEGNLLGIGEPTGPPAVADPVAAVRGVFDAWATGDRAALEALLADDFRFFSPRDDGLDRAAYFEVCWPHHASLSGHNLVRIGEISPGVVVVTYVSGRVDGDERFCNTEIFTVRDGQVREVEVFFGRTL